MFAGIATGGWLCMTGSASAVDVTPPPVLQSVTATVEPVVSATTTIAQSTDNSVTQPVTEVALTVAAASESPTAVVAPVVTKTTTTKSSVEQSSAPVTKAVSRVVSETSVKVAEAPKTIGTAVAYTTKPIENVEEIGTATMSSTVPVITVSGTLNVMPRVIPVAPLPDLGIVDTAPLADLVAPIGQTAGNLGATLSDALGPENEVSVFGAAMGPAVAAGTGTAVAASHAVDEYGGLAGGVSAVQFSLPTLHADAVQPRSPGPSPSAPAAPFGAGLVASVAAALSASTYAGALAGFLGFLIVCGLSGSRLVGAVARRIGPSYGVEPSVSPA